MLGFKDAVLRNLDEAWGALSDIQACCLKMMSLCIEIKSTGDKIHKRLRFHQFSDSVLIYSLHDEPQDLISILILSSQLFADNMRRCIPLRGGISHGEFLFNDRNPMLPIYCGRPLIKAHSIGEMAQWLGIIVDDEVAKHYQKHANMLSSYGIPNIIQWDVPFKHEGKKKVWVVNWPAIFSRNFKKRPPFSVHEYYLAFESLFGPYSGLSQDIKVKYENTVEFINANLAIER